MRSQSPTRPRHVETSHRPRHNARNRWRYGCIASNVVRGTIDQRQGLDNEVEWPDAHHTRPHSELRNREFLGVALLPSRNGDHHTKKQDEEWDHRRLNTEW